jgi:hypothetical protein
VGVCRYAKSTREQEDGRYEYGCGAQNAKKITGTDFNGIALARNEYYRSEHLGAGNHSDGKR